MVAGSPTTRKVTAYPQHYEAFMSRLPSLDRTPHTILAGTHDSLTRLFAATANATRDPDGAPLHLSAFEYEAAFVGQQFFPNLNAPLAATVSSVSRRPVGAPTYDFVGHGAALDELFVTGKSTAALTEQLSAYVKLQAPTASTAELMALVGQVCGKVIRSMPRDTHTARQPLSFDDVEKLALSLIEVRDQQIGAVDYLSRDSFNQRVVAMVHRFGVSGRDDERVKALLQKLPVEG